MGFLKKTFKFSFFYLGASSTPGSATKNYTMEKSLSDALVGAASKVESLTFYFMMMIVRRRRRRGRWW